VRVMRVEGFAERRGSASEARALYSEPAGRAEGYNAGQTRGTA